VSTEALEDKFRSLVGPRFGPAVAEQAITAVNRLEQCHDMAGAFSDLAPAADLIAGGP
jgi:hypothetical protein